jgi:hypothetical protein
MTDPRLEIKAAPRALPPGWHVDIPVFSLAWQATQRWNEEIGRLRESRQAAVENENQAWITLADECFHLQKVYVALAPAMDQSGLPRGARELALAIRRLEQTLQVHGVEVVAPSESIYSADLAEVLESVAQVPRPGIEEPVVQEVLLPVIRRAGQVIRLGKAIIAVPERTDVD